MIRGDLLCHLSAAEVDAVTSVRDFRVVDMQPTTTTLAIILGFRALRWDGIGGYNPELLTGLIA